MLSVVLRSLLKCINYDMRTILEMATLKRFQMSLKPDPYKGFIVKKGKCVGHFQKRVGSRLRRLKKEHGKELLSDGKCRLGDKDTNRLQNYFGIAIRANSHSVEEMQKAIGAVLYHCSESNDPEARHVLR